MKFRFRNLIAAANEVLTGQVNMIGAANEMKDLGEGRYLIPYGSYPHSKGLQVFEESDALNVVDAFNEVRGKNPTWMPAVYVGHPDVPEFKDEYKDKGAYGWIDTMAANTDGFEIHIDWNDDGRELVTGRKYRYFSPYFYLVKASNEGRKVIRPVFLKSIGLTNEPNIGGCWLANEAPTQTQGDSMGLLERLLALINKDDVKTEDDVVNLWQRMIDAFKKFNDASKEKWDIESVAWEVAENESAEDCALALISGIEGLVTAANDAVPEAATTQISDLTTQVETLTADLETANGLVAAGNTAVEGAAGAFADLAIAQGKLRPADKDTQIAALIEADDLVVAGNTLLAGEPVIKTEPTAKDLKVLDMSAGQKRDAQIAAANTIMDANPGMLFPKAWAKAKASSEYSALFEVDSQPE